MHFCMDRDGKIGHFQVIPFISAAEATVNLDL